MTTVTDQSKAAYVLASKYLVELVRQISPDDFSKPGLGTWSVLELIAHANRGHTTLVDYTLDPREPEQPGSHYFDRSSIDARARDAVTLLGDNPSAAVADWSSKATRLVYESALDMPLNTPMGKTTFGTYLPSRTAELTIHGLDLARTLQLGSSAPPESLLESLNLVSQRIIVRGKGEELLLALSGRGALAPDISAF